MIEIGTVYDLEHDPEAYWILYDLYLENNWASTNSPIYPWLRSFSEWSRSGDQSYSISGSLDISHINNEAISVVGWTACSNGYCSIFK
jgi:hypothetical protein